jgi:hypothetical protein
VAGSIPTGDPATKDVTLRARSASPMRRSTASTPHSWITGCPKLDQAPSSAIGRQRGATGYAGRPTSGDPSRRRPRRPMTSIGTGSWPTTARVETAVGRIGNLGPSPDIRGAKHPPRYFKNMDSAGPRLECRIRLARRLPAETVRKVMNFSPPPGSGTRLVSFPRSCRTSVGWERSPRGGEMQNRDQPHAP